MAKRDDHEMATVIGKKVHDDVTRLAAGDDEVLIVIILPVGFAENALLVRFIFFGKRCYVLRAPWRKESLHD